MRRSDRKFDEQRRRRTICRSCGGQGEIMNDDIGYAPSPCPVDYFQARCPNCQQEWIFAES